MHSGNRIYEKIYKHWPLDILTSRLISYELDGPCSIITKSRIFGANSTLCLKNYEECFPWVVKITIHFYLARKLKHVEFYIYSPIRLHDLELSRRFNCTIVFDLAAVTRGRLFVSLYYVYCINYRSQVGVHFSCIRLYVIYWIGYSAAR